MELGEAAWCEADPYVAVAAMRDVRAEVCCDPVGILLLPPGPFRVEVRSDCDCTGEAVRGCCWVECCEINFNLVRLELRGGARYAKRLSNHVLRQHCKGRFLFL